MGAIEDIYAELKADVSKDEFREAVEEKVEEMGGLADEETAAMLIKHDLDGGEVHTISDIEAGLEEAKFLGKILTIGELRTFERSTPGGTEATDEEETTVDDAGSDPSPEPREKSAGDAQSGDAESNGEVGHVLNVELADESGAVRVALWDDDAIAAGDELEKGQVLRVKGRPKEGYKGVEVNADRVEVDEEAEIDVEVGGRATVDGLTLGQSDVNLTGVVLDTDTVRTFDRDDGSEGRVSNVTLGDETGRIRVTLWDERADRVEELTAGETVEVVDGYVRERDGDLELHVGSQGRIVESDESVEFVPDTTDIASVDIEETVDIAGVVRSADPKRTFDRDDGSEGQVRNIRVQDETGAIRVALWGEKADVELGPGDEVVCTDVEIQDGWQDDIEASAGWQATVTVLDAAAPTAQPEDTSSLEEFTTDETEHEGDSGGADPTNPVAPDGEADGEGAPETFTGTVVQPGDPVILDSGEETLHVETDADVHLGQEVTVRGRRTEDRFIADDVF